MAPFGGQMVETNASSIFGGKIGWAAEMWNEEAQIRAGLFICGIVNLHKLEKLSDFYFLAGCSKHRSDFFNFETERLQMSAND